MHSNKNISNYSITFPDLSIFKFSVYYIKNVNFYKKVNHLQLLKIEGNVFFEYYEDGKGKIYRFIGGHKNDFVVIFDAKDTNKSKHIIIEKVGKYSFVPYMRLYKNLSFVEEYKKIYTHSYIANNVIKLDNGYIIELNSVGGGLFLTEIDWLKHCSHLKKMEFDAFIWNKKNMILFLIIIYLLTLFVRSILLI